MFSLISLLIISAKNIRGVLKAGSTLLSLFKPFNFLLLQCQSMFAIKRRNLMECSVISPALSLLMKYLVIGQRKKNSLFLGFSLVTTR